MVRRVKRGKGLLSSMNQNSERRSQRKVNKRRRKLTPTEKWPARRDLDAAESWSDRDLLGYWLAMHLKKHGYEDPDFASTTSKAAMGATSRIGRVKRDFFSRSARSTARYIAWTFKLALEGADTGFPAEGVFHHHQAFPRKGGRDWLPAKYVRERMRTIRGRSDGG